MKQKRYRFEYSLSIGAYTVRKHFFWFIWEDIAYPKTIYTKEQVEKVIEDIKANTDIEVVI